MKTQNGIHTEKIFHRVFNNRNKKMGEYELGLKDKRWEISFRVNDDEGSSSEHSSEQLEEHIDFIIRDKKKNIIFRFNPNTTDATTTIIFPSEVADGKIKTKTVDHSFRLEKNQLVEVKISLCANKVITFTHGKLHLATNLGEHADDLGNMKISYSEGIQLTKPVFFGCEKRKEEEEDKIEEFVPLFVLCGIVLLTIAIIGTIVILIKFGVINA